MQKRPNLFADASRLLKGYTYTPLQLSGSSDDPADLWRCEKRGAQASGFDIAVTLRGIAVIGTSVNLLFREGRSIHFLATGDVYDDLYHQLHDLCQRDEFDRQTFLGIVCERSLGFLKSHWPSLCYAVENLNGSVRGEARVRRYLEAADRCLELEAVGRCLEPEAAGRWLKADLSRDDVSSRLLRMLREALEIGSIELGLHFLHKWERRGVISGSTFDVRFRRLPRDLILQLHVVSLAAKEIMKCAAAIARQTRSHESDQGGDLVA